MPYDYQGGPAFIVSGTLSISKHLLSHQAELIVRASRTEERDVWMNAVRFRICSWRILYSRFKSELLDKSLSPEVLRSIAGVRKGVKRVDDARIESQSPSEAVDKVERWKILPEAVEKLSGFADTVATVVKTSATAVKDTAEVIADVCKCVTIESSAFQVVVLCATLVETGIDMNRGGEAFPRIRETLNELHGDIVDSMVYVLRPDAKVNELLIRSAFQVPENLFDVAVDVGGKGLFNQP